MPDDAPSTAGRLPEGATAAIAVEIGYLRTVAGTAAVNPEAFDFAVLAPRFDRALAALEAVLKLADELAGPDDSPERSALTEDRAWVRQECAARLRETITAKLTGKGASDV